MKQKPTDPSPSILRIAAASCLGALVGIVLGAVMSNLTGGGGPWVGVGAGVGVIGGISISYVLANRRKDK